MLTFVSLTYGLTNVANFFIFLSIVVYHCNQAFDIKVLSALLKKEEKENSYFDTF